MVTIVSWKILFTYILIYLRWNCHINHYFPKHQIVSGCMSEFSNGSFIYLALDMFFRTCEICNSVARNVFGGNEIESIQQTNETNVAIADSVSASVPPHTETRSWLNGHRLVNFLLACMVLAFVISWLFHFNIPSWKSRITFFVWRGPAKRIVIFFGDDLII